MQNLNDTNLVQTDGEIERAGFREINLRNQACRSGAVTVYFSDLEERLIWHIEEASIVLGCVAWLTNEPILRALASVETSILIQKEDFLRPDNGSDKTGLRLLYGELHMGFERHQFDGMVGNLSMCGDPTVDPIRCVGVGGKNRNRPRMHHKFLVFCHEVYRKREWPWIEAYAVWTGSFNMTYMATQSLENAVFIRDEEIARRYVDEWAYAFALSESLDWEHEYVEPDYRLGT